jgi:hypothetical protein
MIILLLTCLLSVNFLVAHNEEIPPPKLRRTYGYYVSPEKLVGLSSEQRQRVILLAREAAQRNGEARQRQLED